ncbi:MAG: carbohydrate kinase [Prevotella sp.]
MRKAIGIGETILDIVFRESQPIAAVPGGSVFNAMVSLGRAGASSVFISDTAADRVGDFISQFMSDNGIDTAYMNTDRHAKSPISLAFLDEENNADYIFYKTIQEAQPDVLLPEISPDDVLLIGSYYAVDSRTRQRVLSLLERAKESGAIVYYDVNFRMAHKNDVMRITPNLIENLEFADIVRGSREDFSVIYRKDNPDSVYRSDISFYCKRLIYTDGAQPAVLMADGGLRRVYEPKSTQVVSTIGAGDNFNAGFIYGLLKLGIRRADLEGGLTAEQWDALMGYAMDFAAESCRGLANYVSEDFVNRLGKL